MKNRRLHIILILLLSITSSIGYSQEIVLCNGEKAIYKVESDYAFNSTFVWEEPEGGEIVENYGDSVIVQWNTGIDTGKLAVTEVGFGGCEGELITYSQAFSSLQANLTYESDEICLGDVMQFETEEDYTSYTWPDGSQGESYSVDSAGLVWVQVTDEFGCEAVDSVYLTVHDLPEVDISVTSAYIDRIFMGEDSISFIGGEVNNITLDAGIWNWYEWSTGETMSTIDVSARDIAQATEDQKTEYFWVTVENEYGCRNTDSLAVTVIRQLKIPNAITPNGDGSNDRWEIPGLSLYPNAKVQIFDRWGDVVYTANGYDESKYWEGKDNRGRKLPMDSYYYVIKLGNGEKPIYGSVTIIR